MTRLEKMKKYISSHKVDRWEEFIKVERRFGVILDFFS